jgi:hypothetical protein
MRICPSSRRRLPSQLCIYLARLYFWNKLKHVLIPAMSAAQAQPVCAVCSGGPSRDRALLQCGSEVCTDGPWFHSDCIGSAIISRNVQKAQHWLCPWCVLKQPSRLSERQLLALTLQTSRLDSLRSDSKRPGYESCVAVAVRSNPSRPNLLNVSSMCSPKVIPPSLGSGFGCSKKRSTMVLCDPPLLGSGGDELSGTCAKCRREYACI